MFKIVSQAQLASLIALIFVLLALPAFGQFFELDSLYIDAKKFTGRGNDEVMSAIGRQQDKGLTLGLNINFLEFMYFTNKLEGRTGCINGEQCQFSEVSYNFNVGAHIFPWLDLNYSHLSSHALDNNYGYNVEDSIGFRVYIFKNDKNNVLLP